MTSSGRVLSVDQVSDRDGAPVWQVITDYAEKRPDGLSECAFYLPRPGPVPAIGETVGWGHSLGRGAWAYWRGEWHKRTGFAFAPDDPRLYTG